MAAETAGQVLRVYFDAGDRVERGDVLAELDAEIQQQAVNSASAEIRRLTALLENQRVRVDRLANLAARQSVAQDQLDEARTQVAALAAEIDEARARLGDARFNLARTRITSPVSGQIQRRLVSPGDFVSPGVVMFGLVAPDSLRALLPLPERLQDEVAIGQTVRFSLPGRPQERVESRVGEIRPMVGERSRAIELIVDLANPGGWRAGGSVNASIVLETRSGIVVPAHALVRRPAGEVVYVVEGNRARQRTVHSGLRLGDEVEILEGLDEGEVLVVDGAGFLTDGALLDIQEPDDDAA